MSTRARRRPWQLLLLAATILLAACTPSRRDIRKATVTVRLAQPAATTCARNDHCATPSPLLAEAHEMLARSRSGRPQHMVTILENGGAALAARVNLIRAARRSIDVQTYIWEMDDAGQLVLDELVRAARRGVRVRILADQLFSFDDAELLARLARTSPNLHIRLYNPTFDKAETPPLEFAAGVLCCFVKFNQRMHNKLLLVDNSIGITGGRNYQDRYFGWNPRFDYRDRDIMVGGPAAHEMARSFERFWNHRRAVPLTALRDVNRQLREDGPHAPGWRPTAFRKPQRVAQLRAEAEDPRWLGEHLLAQTLTVGHVEFFSDLPAKTNAPDRRRANELTEHIMSLIRGAKNEIVLQTPYLVLSHRARDIFVALHRRAHPPRVTVSTNSLASTDAFAVYALSYKHRKRYLRDYGFDIYELKPHPHDGAGSGPGAPPLARPVLAPVEATRPGLRASGRSSWSRRRSLPAPLNTPGVRTGLHAKSIVVDGEFAMIGSHNFDPRSDHYNTESGVIVYDHRFAERVRRQILRDTRPRNAWVIAARRPKVPLLTELNQMIGSLSEKLPLFDFWPFRYATDYELKPGCQPLRREDPRFHRCYRSVGDFPEVALPFKTIYTRLITAFGAGIRGIL